MYAGIVDWPWWINVLVTLGLTHVTIAAVTISLRRLQELSLRLRSYSLT
ncbi:hypothetical protein [Propionivibrio sp.]